MYFFLKKVGYLVLWSQSEWPEGELSVVTFVKDKQLFISSLNSLLAIWGRGRVQGVSGSPGWVLTFVVDEDRVSLRCPPLLRLRE